MKFNIKVVAAFFCTLLLLLLVVMLGSDYIEYRRNYQDFQNYLAEKNKKGENEPVNVTTPITEMIPEESLPKGEPVSAPGSNFIADVSGNVIWQADISSEDMERIRSYAEQRREIYGYPDSYEKTIQIAELDQQILDAAQCRFPNVKINFVGDSITEGIAGLEKPDGSHVSYVDYVQEKLGFGTCINSGKAGRFIGAYSSSSEYSIGLHENEIIANYVDITVLYAGVNDYFGEINPKNWGVVNDGSTGGYCGQAQRLFHSLQNNYPGMDIFVVTAYQTPISGGGTEFINFDGIPCLNDYMEIQRMLSNECGFHLIDLYDCGFMDMHDEKTAEVFLGDIMHPNDEGYRILGTHIAAEIVLYYLGIE